MNRPVLRVERLSFGYSGQPVFIDWSADVLPGVTWVRGGDGSGKTTLLKLIAGELQGTGSIVIESPGPGSGGIRQQRADGRNVAWCDPQTDAFDSLTPLAWFDRLRRQRPSFDDAELQRHVAGFTLEAHLLKPLYQLSTGSKRKVWLAGSLASTAPVTLLDQPQAALDEHSTRHLLRTLGLCAGHPSRAWVVADHEWPEGVARTGVIQLPD